MWVNVVPALLLLMVKLSVVVPAGAMLDEPKDFAIVGAAMPATVKVAVAVPPIPPSNEDTVPVVLTLVPDVWAVTLTLNVHEPLAGSAAPPKLMLPNPAGAVIVPPPQLPVTTLGVETT